MVDSVATSVFGPLGQRPDPLQGALHVRPVLARRWWRILDSLSGIASRAGVSPLRTGPDAHRLREAGAVAVGRRSCRPTSLRARSTSPTAHSKRRGGSQADDDRRRLPVPDGVVVAAADEAGALGRPGGAVDPLGAQQLGAEAGRQRMSVTIAHTSSGGAAITTSACVVGPSAKRSGASGASVTSADGNRRRRRTVRSAGAGRHRQHRPRRHRLASGRAARGRLGVGPGGLGRGRLHAARLPRRRTSTIGLATGIAQLGRSYTGQPGDDRDVGPAAVGRPLPARHRHQRTAGHGGLARRAVRRRPSPPPARRSRSCGGRGW